MQVAAMERQVGRAIALLDEATPGMVVGHLAGDCFPVKGGCGCEREGTQAILDAERAMDLHGIRALLDAGTDPSKGLCLLVDGRLDADLTQRRRHGEPADAGADDGDGWAPPLAHAVSYRVAAILSRKAARSSVT